MKEIRLFLVRKNYSYGDHGYWELVMIEDNENIYEELAKKHNIKVTEKDKELDMDLYFKVGLKYDVKEVDLERLSALLG